MTATHTNPAEGRAAHASPERVAELLARYPHISPQNVREILTFLKTGSHLEIGLLTANDNLRPRLDAFMHDHKRDFRLKAGETIYVVGLITAFLVVCWLLWELSGAGAR